MRLSSVLAEALVLLMLYVHVWRRFGRHDAAALSAIACAGIPTFHAYAAVAISDPPFVACTTLACVATLRTLRDPRWLPVVGLGLGLATACKSLAVAIPALALAPYLWISVRRHRAHRAALLMVVLAFALALPFYVHGFATQGAEFWRQHFTYSLLSRGRGTIGHGNMGGGPTAYLQWIWQNDGPLFALWMLAAVTGAGLLAYRHRTFDSELALLAWTPTCMLVLYSAFGSRLPHYILPIYPVVALGLGHVYATLSQSIRLGAVSALYAPLAACGLLLVGQWDHDAEKALLYDDAAVVLGKAARQRTEQGEVIFIHEWYAPALAYYASRPFRLTTSITARYRAVRSVDFFEQAGVPVLVPPAPVPKGSRIIVAGAPSDLQKANWIEPTEVLAEFQGRMLIRARTR